MAGHYNTSILPTRSRKPRDNGQVEGTVLIVERWIWARLRNRRFFSLSDLNAAITVLLEDLNNRPMRHVGKSRGDLFEEIERTALSPLPPAPFEYAEWKSAKVHPDYHVEVDRTRRSREDGHRVGPRSGLPGGDEAARAVGGFGEGTSISPTGAWASPMRPGDRVPQAQRAPRGCLEIAKMRGLDAF